MARKPNKAAKYPQPSSPEVSFRMQRNTKTNTGPETRVRSELRRRGHHFDSNRLINVGTLRVRPDLVYLQARLAVFIDGCFWHSCPIHGNIPKVNRRYWSPKLQRTAIRDGLIVAKLSSGGWAVLRLWEHDPTETAARKIELTLLGITHRTSHARRGRHLDAPSHA